MTDRSSAAGREPMSVLLDAAQPSGQALLVPEDGRVLTYGQAADWIETLAARLAGAGVRRGDRVALALPNGPDFVLLVLALTLLGAAAVPLNPTYTESEFTYFLEDIGPRLFLVLAGRPASATAAAEATGTAVLTDDVAVLLHTSGTASRPKQVPLRQGNLMASTRTIAAHYELGPSDVSFLRHAAVPRARPGGLRLRGAECRGYGHRAPPVHPA